MALNSPLRLLLTLCEGFVGVSTLFLPVYRPCEESDRQVSITIGHEKHNYTLRRLPSVSLRAQVANPPSRGCPLG
jgi:hypothetical protein